MKRKIALVLALTMIVSILFPIHAMAAYDKELEEAITTTKTLFNLPGGFDNFSYNINRQNDKIAFDLNWNDSKNRLGSINVTIDSLGRVINYSSYRPSNNKNPKKLPAISHADARKIADQFMHKVSPASWNKVQYWENNTPLTIADRNYQFRYIRVENSVPFPDNSIYISIDGMTGDVQSFNYNWFDDAVFPDTNGAMTLENAQRQFKEKLGLKLVYKLDFNDKEPKPYLVYANVYSDRFIDAKTGDIVFGNNSNGYYGGNEKSMKSDAQRSNSVERSISLSPKELEAVESAADVMDQSKAESTARNAFNIDSTYKLNYVSLYNDWRSKEDYLWNMNFGLETKTGGDPQSSNISVSLDAKNGSVLSFYKFSPIDSKAQASYNESQSLKIAEDFIKSLQPEKFLEVERTAWSQPINTPMIEGVEPRELYFNFSRKVNGAYFMENGFNVTVDNTTGNVTGYSFNWYKKSLPPTDKIITIDQAYKLLFDSIGLQKQYISQYPQTREGKILPPVGRQKPDIKLVYAIKPEKPINIDANTGELLDYNGRPVAAENVVGYTDIRGNYAESQIRILAEYGIAWPGNQFKPTQNVTQRDFLYLVQRAVNPYLELKPTEDGKDDDNLYNSLIGAGIVKEGERSPKAIVTRQDAVKFIVRALNYEKVAEIKKDIFILPFKDAKKIKPGYSGYMAIAYGLNIIQGANGYCNPGSSLTRADGVIMLYNFLNV